MANLARSLKATLDKKKRIILSRDIIRINTNCSALHIVTLFVKKRQGRALTITVGNMHSEQ